MLHGQGLNGVAGRQSIGKAGAHHARKGGYSHTLLQVEFFDGHFLLLGRHRALFKNAGDARGSDSEQANENAEKNDSSRSRPHHLGHEFAAKNRRDQGSESGAEAEHNGHSQ